MPGPGGFKGGPKAKNAKGTLLDFLNFFSNITRPISL